MEYHYEYGTYNSHHKVLDVVNLQASNMDALRSKSCVPFSQICSECTGPSLRKAPLKTARCLPREWSPVQPTLE